MHCIRNNMAIKPQTWIRLINMLNIVWWLKMTEIPTLAMSQLVTGTCQSQNVLFVKTSAAVTCCLNDSIEAYKNCYKCADGPGSEFPWSVLQSLAFFVWGLFRQACGFWGNSGGSECGIMPCHLTEWMGSCGVGGRINCCLPLHYLLTTKYFYFLT